MIRLIRGAQVHSKDKYAPSISSSGSPSILISISKSTVNSVLASLIEQRGHLYLGSSRLPVLQMTDKYIGYGYKQGGRTQEISHFVHLRVPLDVSCCWFQCFRKSPVRLCGVEKAVDYGGLVDKRALRLYIPCKKSCLKSGS